MTPRAIWVQASNQNFQFSLSKRCKDYFMDDWHWKFYDQTFVGQNLTGKKTMKLWLKKVATRYDQLY